MPERAWVRPCAEPYRLAAKFPSGPALTNKNGLCQRKLALCHKLDKAVNVRRERARSVRSELNADDMNHGHLLDLFVVASLLPKTGPHFFGRDALMCCQTPNLPHSSKISQKRDFAEQRLSDGRSNAIITPIAAAASHDSRARPGSFDLTIVDAPGMAQAPLGFVTVKLRWRNGTRGSIPTFASHGYRRTSQCLNQKNH